jgi:DNA-binding response OmpR family regulator
VTDVLVVTDADWVFDEVDASLGDEETTVHRLRAGVEVRPWVKEHEPDLVVLDMQIGNMGGIAACLDLRLEAGARRIVEPVILVLLDRQADVFLARRSEADGWLIKPLDSMRLRRAATALLSGQTFHEGLPEEASADASVEAALPEGDQAAAVAGTSDA